MKYIVQSNQERPVYLLVKPGEKKGDDPTVTVVMDKSKATQFTDKGVADKYAGQLNAAAKKRGGKAQYRVATLT